MQVSYYFIKEPPMKKIARSPEEMHEFRNDYLHLIIDEGAKLMYSEWVRKPNSQEYQEITAVFTRFLREKDIYYWIQDTNLLGEVSLEDLNVVLQKLVPVAASSSLKKLARISSDDQYMLAFMKLASQSGAQLSTDIEVQNFLTYREAVDWISNS